MRTAQAGDRVQVHYVLRAQDGSVSSSRCRPPLELTVGIDHPRLPGLGLALVGLAPGEGTTLTVPPERAYGLSDPGRIHRCSRQRFPPNVALRIGSLERVTDDQGRHRLVRIVQVSGPVVVVDVNHRWAGQIIQMAVQLMAIGAPALGLEAWGPERGKQTYPATEAPGTQHLEKGPAFRREVSSTTARAIAFDVAAAPLASLREGLPGWEIDTINGATAAFLAHNWNPGAANLLVVSARGARDDATRALSLCRFLSFCTRYSTDAREAAAEALGPGTNLPALRPDAPLLVLVPPGPGQAIFVGAALEAGARRCLVLPIHPRDVASMLAHVRAADQAIRHTPNFERAQTEDCRRDDRRQG